MKKFKNLVRKGFAALILAIMLSSLYFVVTAYGFGLLDFWDFFIGWVVAICISVPAIKVLFEKKEDEAELKDVPVYGKFPLRYKIIQIENADGLRRYRYEIHAGNNELICTSDEYHTRRGAESGVFYLENKIKSSSIEPWS